MTEPSGPWEREVRRFVLAGLAFLLFLAGASLVALRMTTRWAIGQSEERLVAETRAIAARFGSTRDLATALTGDARVVSLVREYAPQQIALFDARGALLRSVAWLPDAARVPDRLGASELPGPGGARLARAEEAGAPIAVVTVAVDDGALVLRALYDATPIVAAERTLVILAVVVPAGVGLLVILVVPFLRRLTRPIDALAETARSAEALVPPVGDEGRPAHAAVAAFARTIGELRQRTLELERLRQREKERADALAITAETLVRSHPGGLLVVGSDGEITEANGPEVIRDFRVEVPIEVPDRDSWIVIVAMGLSDENQPRPMIFDIPFGEIQLSQTASGAFADVPVVNQLLAATPSVPDWSPIVPYAITNPIYLDVDGNGRYDAPLGPAPFCSQPCETDDECPFGEVCVGVCGFAIDGGCNIPRTLPAPD